jgi:hypothetical protein
MMIIREIITGPYIRYNYVSYALTMQYRMWNVFMESALDPTEDMRIYLSIKITRTA